MMTFGSLFAGIGGFDLGLERAGMRALWRSEIDSQCNALTDERMPNIQNFGDVRNVTKRNAATPYVICGGFPCQDLSVAGKRAGLAGSRSGLWFEFYRVLTELGPQWAVIENVPVYYRLTGDGTLPSSWKGWRKSGIYRPGECLTLNTTEWPNAGVVCSLSQVLETDVPQKYYLSARACRGILRRAGIRGRELPELLQEALLVVAATENEAEATE